MKPVPQWPEWAQILVTIALIPFAILSDAVHTAMRWLNIPHVHDEPPCVLIEKEKK